MLRSQDRTLHQKLHTAISLYEQKKITTRRLNSARKKDIEHIKSCLMNIPDEPLLVAELKYYLNHLKTPGYLRAREGGYSELRETLLVVIRDAENGMLSCQSEEEKTLSQRVMQLELLLTNMLTLDQKNRNRSDLILE